MTEATDIKRTEAPHATARLSAFKHDLRVACVPAAPRPTSLDPVTGRGLWFAHMPLNQVATVTVPEPRLLSVSGLGQVDGKRRRNVRSASSNLGLQPDRPTARTCACVLPELNEKASQGAGQGRA